MEKQKLSREQQQTLAALNRAIFVREAGEAASLYDALLREVPDFLLRGPAQYDLARLLETASHHELALKAYQGIIDRQKDNHARNPSLKAAGTICWHLRRYEDCLNYLEQYLKTKPMTPDRQEAEEILSRLPPEATAGRTTPIVKESAPAAPRVDEIPSSWNIEEGKPVTFEWKMAKKKVHKERMPPGIIVEQPKDETRESIHMSEIPGIEHPAPLSPEPPPLYIPQHAANRASSGQVPLPPPGYPVGWPMSPQPYYPAPPQGYGTHYPQPAYPPQPPPSGVYPLPPPQQPPPPSYPIPAFSAPLPPPLVPPPVHAPPPPEPKPAVPAFAPLPSPQSESAEARYDRLREGQFALILPLGKRIHLDTVSELIASYSDIPEAEAKKLVLKRKGVLYDGLTLTQVLDLCPLVRKCRQSLIFVSVPRDLKPYEHHDVLGAEMREQGLKMTTENSVKRIRWSDVRLVNCGVVNGHTVATLVGSEPAKEYQFSSAFFNYHTFSPTGLADFRTGIAEFLELVAGHAAKALKSHTVENILNRKMVSPQVFPSEEEYEYYKSWVLYSHFAEVINTDELSELNQVSSNW